MRQSSTFFLESESDTMLGEVASDEIVGKIVSNWKSDYGDLLDFGGGVKDVTCQSVLALCEGNAKALKKLFPILLTSEASGIISLCKEAVKSDV